MKKNILFLALVAVMVIPEVASAGTFNVPTVLKEYGDTLMGMVAGVIAGVVIMIMLFKGGWEMFANANASPIKWGLAAAVVIGGAVWLAPKFVGFAETTFDNNTTSTSTVTTQQ